MWSMVKPMKSLFKLPGQVRGLLSTTEEGNCLCLHPKKKYKTHILWNKTKYSDAYKTLLKFSL